MARRFIVRPLAEADLEDAARWYEAERAGLTDRFLSDVDRTLHASVTGHSSSPQWPPMSDEHCFALFRTRFIPGIR